MLCAVTQVELMDYSVQSVTEGIEALAITRISLRPTGKLASEGFTTNAQVSLIAQRTFLRNSSLVHTLWSGRASKPGQFQKPKFKCGSLPRQQTG